jgi:hypothetical protein
LCAVTNAPQASIFCTVNSTSLGVMVEIGFLPMYGKASFSSHVVSFGCFFQPLSSYGFERVGRCVHQDPLLLAFVHAGVNPLSD